MKKYFRNIAVALCVLISALMLFTACNGNTPTGDSSGGNNGEIIDYVSQLKFDLQSETKKQEVTVRLYIDGDTTHFDPVTNSTITGYNAADFAETEGYIKARYLAVNTPENTGVIEEWGQKAADFVEEKLKNAQTIIVESDDGNWNIDSTGERYTLWVWYLPKDATEYRNLNLELLQEGLGRGSGTASNRYGEKALGALNQAMDKKLYVFSEAQDPDYFYGEAIPVTLKELRCHVNDYADKKIRVEGIITSEFGGSVYIEDFDADTGVSFGMAVYYGYPKDDILSILKIGNRVSLVGTIKEFQGTYQISDVHYSRYNNSSDNSSLISKGNELKFAEVEAKNIVSGSLKVNFDKEDEEGNVKIETVNINYGEAIMSTSVTVKELTVESAYTTQEGGNKGAISLKCKAKDGTTITVRTEVLKDADNKLITQDKYVGKTITVKGIIEKFNDKYQVKVYRDDYITILA